MMYHCGGCGAALLIPSSAAWPGCCPYCGLTPLEARLGQARSPLATPLPTWGGHGVAGGAQALAEELLEAARGARAAA